MRTNQKMAVKYDGEKLVIEHENGVVLQLKMLPAMMTSLADGEHVKVRGSYIIPERLIPNAKQVARNNMRSATNAENWH